MADIREWQRRIRAINHAHGFESAGRELFCEKMLLVVSEISEALEEFRDGREIAEIYYNPDKPGKPEGIPVEIADTVIRLLDFCEANGIDLDKVLELKTAYNEKRPHKHGRLL